MDIIKVSEQFAKKEYIKNDPMHRWLHIESVMKRAIEIASKIKDVDIELLKLAVIFHDIDYHSKETFKENYDAHVENSICVADKFLNKNGYPKIES